MIGLIELIDAVKLGEIITKSSPSVITSFLSVNSKILSLNSLLDLKSNIGFDILPLKLSKLKKLNSPELGLKISFGELSPISFRFFFFFKYKISFAIMF